MHKVCDGIHKINPLRFNVENKKARSIPCALNWDRISEFRIKSERTTAERKTRILLLYYRERIMHMPHISYKRLPSRVWLWLCDVCMTRVLSRNMFSFIFSNAFLFVHRSIMLERLERIFRMNNITLEMRRVNIWCLEPILIEWNKYLQL